MHKYIHVFCGVRAVRMRHTLYTGQGNGTDTGSETGQDQGLHIHSFFLLMALFICVDLQERNQTSIKIKTRSLKVLKGMRKKR